MKRHQSRIQEYARREGMTAEDLKLELEADKLLREAGANELTINARALADERHPVSEYPTGLTCNTLLSTVDEEALAAIEATGTEIERFVWREWLCSGDTQAEIAQKLGVTQQAVCKALSRCKTKVKNYQSAYSGWESIYWSEVSRKGKFAGFAKEEDNLPAELIEARQMIEETAGLTTMMIDGKDFGDGIEAHVRLVRENGDPLQPVVRLTIDQTLTLAWTGQVRLSGKKIIDLEGLCGC